MKNTESINEKVLKLIPKGRATDKEMIISFEKIDKLMIKNSIGLSNLAINLYKKDRELFNKVDKYFKKVHSIIRKRAEKSKLWDENIELIALNNFRGNTGICFGKKQAVNAFHRVLDHYDPNKRQKRRHGIYNWEGFWSLISTKNGKITGCYLSDTDDREKFYKSLNKK